MSSSTADLSSTVAVAYYDCTLCLHCRSQRSAEIIVNPNAAYAALQGSPNATPTLAHKTHLQTASPLVVPQDPNANLTYANVDSLAGDRYIAKYDFIGSTDIELPLKKGETVIVVERAESGWCQGICAGHMGWFPESYVKPAPVEIQSQVQPRRMSEMMAGEVEELEVSGGDSWVLIAVSAIL